MLPPDLVRATAARVKKKEAEARRKAEPDAPRELAGVQEAATGRPTGAETKKKGAVVKTKRRADATRPKRPRSPSPPIQPSKRREAVEVPIDLTLDTPEESRGELQPSHAVPEVTPIQVVQTTSAPAPPDEPRAAEPPSEAEPVTGTAVPVETGEGTEVETITFRSLADRGKWAERIMSPVNVPGIRKGLLGRSSSSFFRDALASHLWAVNSLTTLREVLSQAEAALHEARGETEAERARADEAVKALDTARAEDAEAVFQASYAKAKAQLEGEIERALATARAERAEAVAQMEAAQAGKAEAIAQLEAAQAEAMARMKVAEDEVRAHQESTEKAMEAARVAKKKGDEVALELFTSRAHLHAAKIETRAAEERAENAEEIARRCDAKLAEIEAEKASALERAASAEEKAARAAEEVAATAKEVADAVALYKQSPAYELELAEETSFAYNLGFQDCKMKAKRVYDIDGVEDMEPDPVDFVPSTGVAPCT